MTVAVILADLAPIMWSEGTGAEIVQRIAAPMIGGMITAPLLSMFVIPAAYLLMRGAIQSPERKSSMKHIVFAALISLPILASAQSGMKGMDMKDMDMKGMKSDKKVGGQVHKGTGVVTNVDRAGGKVTLKHEPIQSLNWPTMTMAFGVKDKAMLDKLAKDKKVQFEFVQQGQQFVITSIK